MVPAGERPAPPTPVTAPIGRLVIAGPDAERKYVDADLKVDWFGKGGPAEADGNGNKAEEAQVQEAQVQEGKVEEAKAPEKPAPVAGADGVVIDLDISGLFDGRGVTAEQAMIVARELREQNEKAARDEPENPAEAKDGAEEKAVGQGAAVSQEAAAGQKPAEEKAEAEAETRAEVKAEAAPEVKTNGVPTAADLDSIRWRLDGGTLREVVDNREGLQRLGEQLDGPLAAEQDDATKAGLLSVRAEVYRLLGELGMAAAASRLALAHAERAGDARALVIAQAELAHTLRLRGDFVEADRLFEQAASSETPEPLRAVVHENAGRSAFDQGRHMEALDHFARAVRLGDEDDMDLAERVGVSLEAVYIHVLRDGWGPYPRMRREIIDPALLGPDQEPAPEA